jgi:hypothetical protein
MGCICKSGLSSLFALNEIKEILYVRNSYVTLSHYAMSELVPRIGTGA